MEKIIQIKWIKVKIVTEDDICGINHTKKD